MATDNLGFGGDRVSYGDPADDPFAAPLAAETAELAISDAAAERLAQLIREEADDTLMLRVRVTGGGCSGFQYHFSFDHALGDDDRVFSRHGVRVVADQDSLALLGGAEIDYVDDLIGAFFRVNNPNATSSCGCGTSFAI